MHPAHEHDEDDLVKDVLGGVADGVCRVRHNAGRHVDNAVERERGVRVDGALSVAALVRCGP